MGFLLGRAALKVMGLPLGSAALKVIGGSLIIMGLPHGGYKDFHYGQQP